LPSLQVLDSGNYYRNLSQTTVTDNYCRQLLQAVNKRFKRLADDAGVTVKPKTPTAKIGRGFWYTTYNEAVKQMMEGLERIAADQGSSSTEAISQTTSQKLKNDATRESMRGELSGVFGQI
jgi:hypothetical protein